MNTPPYRWSCHGCGSSNEPRIAACSTCGLLASATGRQIAAAKARLSPSTAPASVKRADHWLFTNESVFLFFPEGIASALIFLASPGWLLSLLFHGYLKAAGLLLCGVAAAGAVAYFALRERSRGLLYVSVIVSIIVALWVNSLSQQSWPNAA